MLRTYNPAVATTVFLFAIAVTLLALGYALTAMAPIDLPASPALAAEFIVPGMLNPKPHDRFVFQSFVVIGFLTILSMACFRHRLAGPADLEPQTTFAICAVLCLSLAFWIGTSGTFRFLTSEDNLIKTLSGPSIGFLFACFSPIRSGRMWTSARYFWIILLCAGVACLAFETRMFSSTSVSYVTTFVAHFEPAVYSIVQIANGATCLADARPQYGCYGEFIAPVLWVTGMSIRNITGVLAALLAVSIVSVIIFISSIIRSTALIVAASIGAAIPLLMHPFNGMMIDPYFQYTPIRVLFPALSLLCVLAAQRSGSAYKFFFLGIFAAAALIWNLDSGVAVTAALVLFCLSNGALSQPEWLSAVKRLSGFLLGLTSFLVVAMIYLELKSGWQVDLSGAIAYQRLFYFSGLNMMQLPGAPAIWTISAVIIVTSLFVALSHLGNEVSGLWTRCAYLAVLAVGLLIYYSGRSHFVVFILCSWPVPALLCLLADQALLKNRNMFFQMATISVLVGFPVATYNVFFLHAGLDIDPDATARVQQDIDFIKSRTQAREKVAIVAENQGTFYAETDTSPTLPGPSISEMLLFRDLDNLNREISERGPRKLFVNPRAIALQTFWPDLLQIGAHYNFVELSPGERIAFYVRK